MRPCIRKCGSTNGCRRVPSFRRAAGGSAQQVIRDQGATVQRVLDLVLEGGSRITTTEATHTGTLLTAPGRESTNSTWVTPCLTATALRCAPQLRKHQSWPGIYLAQTPQKQSITTLRPTRRQHPAWLQLRAGLADNLKPEQFRVASKNPALDTGSEGKPPDDEGTMSSRKHQLIKIPTVLTIARSHAPLSSALLAAETAPCATQHAQPCTAVTTTARGSVAGVGPYHRCTTDRRRVDHEWLTALACTTVDGHPIAVTGVENALVQVWDLLTGAVRATLTGHRAEVTEVTCGVWTAPGCGHGEHGHDCTDLVLLAGAEAVLRVNATASGNTAARSAGPAPTRNHWRETSCCRCTRVGRVRAQALAAREHRAVAGSTSRTCFERFGTGRPPVPHHR